VIAPVVSANPGFDPMKDFTHIAYIGGPPNVFVANPALGVRSLELVALAGAAPPSITSARRGTPDTCWRNLSQRAGSSCSRS
jgi:hypothetical protein